MQRLSPFVRAISNSNLSTRQWIQEYVLQDTAAMFLAHPFFKPDSETVEQLRSDLEGLLSELADLSHRNDELMIAKESDLAVINNLDMQVKDYKRKYETAKTELRSFKGLFL